jgi:cobalamin biosynthesis Co2+ chelatase CbiK
MSFWQGLKKDQIENLKESLTFLLNEHEFGNIILSQNNGYPEHKELRKKLKNIWSKNKDFQNLLDEAISIIKK